MNCSCLKCGHLVKWTPSLLCKECQKEEDKYYEEDYYSWDHELGQNVTDWATRKVVPESQFDNDEFSE